jgi:hypothetical protein
MADKINVDGHEQVEHVDRMSVRIIMHKEEVILVNVINVERRP